MFMAERTNEEWLDHLTPNHPQYNTAIADLRRILTNGLKRGLLTRINTSVPEFETQVDDFVQEAIMKIIDKKETFAGLSKFTTWAHKIAVSVALTELRRKRWQDTSLDGMMETESGIFTPGIAADPSPTPGQAVEQSDMMARVQRLIQEALTEKQRTAVIAAIIENKPTNQVAKEMNMKPNALYKLLHDARLRLKKALADEGLTPADILAVFD
jgi:RNA polymerase sigma-70 factor (ECF subfamily)